jgi:lipopolysaccharide transport system ATP-binding protein
MALSLKKVSYGPLDNVHASAPDGAIIGVIGEDGAGVSELLSLVAGLAKPKSGAVAAGKLRRLVGPNDPLDLTPVDLLALDHALTRRDALARARTAIQLDHMRRAGSTIVIAESDEEWLARLSDEIWWLHNGKLQHRGDPQVVLGAWRKHIADQIRRWGQALPPAPAAHLRRGDGRAEIVSVETLGETGEPSGIVRSGEWVTVRVTVNFRETVENPVIGMLVRNRIGLDVYGTNSELEHVKLGPRASGETVRLHYRFRCELCPQEYTITVASHDPDGTRHDWIDEAVVLTVIDDRYTAGVANLRARLEVG